METAIKNISDDFYRISAVIPAYNREKTIKRCVDSVLNQIYPIYEIIVVDDGSTDKTLAIIEKEFGDRVSVIRQNHKGAQAARNTGVRVARGEYIAFLDSDDEWLPDKLKLQVQELDKNRGAVICGDGYIQTDWLKEIPTVYRNSGYNQNLNRTGTRKILRMNGKSGYVYKEVLKKSFCLFQGLLTSKENLVQIGLLDENVPSYQEWDTAIRLAEVKEFVYIHKPLFVYHLHDGETISKSSRKEIDGLEYILDKYKYEILCELGCEGLTEKYKVLLRKCLVYKDKRAVHYLIRFILGRMHIFKLK